MGEVLPMPLGPFRPSPLVDQTVRHLRQEITGGRLPVGSRLPGEVALAKELGIGRSTVREALRSLAGAGLVQSRQGSGVFVISDQPNEDWAGRLSRAEAVDVHEVRLLLEVQAARLAAARRTETDLAVLDRALTRRRAAVPLGEEAFVAADLDLHEALVDAAHNPVLAEIFAEFVPALHERLLELAQLSDLRAHDPAPGEDSLAAVVEAVRAGDPEAAAGVLAAELERMLPLPVH